MGITVFEKEKGIYEDEKDVFSDSWKPETGYEETSKR